MGLKRCDVGFGGQAIQCELDIVSVFAKQCELKDDRRRGGSQGDTQRGVTTAPKRPFQGDANIDDYPRKNVLIYVERDCRLTHVQKMLRVTPMNGVSFARFFEFLVGIRLSSFKQEIPNDRTARIREEHRLVDKIREAFQYRLSRNAFAANDLDGVGHTEIACKYTEPGEHDPSLGRQKAATPLENGQQALLTRQRVAAAFGEQRKAIVQSLSYRVNVDQIDPPSGKLHH